MTCKRCTFVWIPCGSRELASTGCLYMLDLGICPKCKRVKSRVHTATPGDQVSAELWGQKFEIVWGEE